MRKLTYMLLLLPLLLNAQTQSRYVEINWADTTWADSLGVQDIEILNYKGDTY